MAWPWEIVERDHEIQNATSPAKIKLLGTYLRLGPEIRVLRCRLLTRRPQPWPQRPRLVPGTVTGA